MLLRNIVEGFSLLNDMEGMNASSPFGLQVDYLPRYNCAAAVKLDRKSVV